MHSLGSATGRARPTGVEAIGHIPWGSHICQFYRTPEDLAEILVPYFKAGLEGNERCIWVTSAPLGVDAARSALREAMADLEVYEARGQIDIVDYHEHYVNTPLDEVIAGWFESEELALREGYLGLRVTGNAYSVERSKWNEFAEYEARIGSTLQGRRIVAVCSYCLDRCAVSDLLDVLRSHECTLVRDERRWKFIPRATETIDGARHASLHNSAPTVRHGHDVQFYAEAQFPAERVGEFLAGTLRSGGGAAAVATPAHLPAICAAIASAGIDVEVATAEGRLLLLDAEKILGWLHVGGQLNEQQFWGLIGGRAHDLSARFPHVRWFGELVDLLCAQGRDADAVRLEGWWNHLRERESLELLCAYSYANFTQAHSLARFEGRVCGARTCRRGGGGRRDPRYRQGPPDGTGQSADGGPRECLGAWAKARTRANEVPERRT